MRIVSGGGGGGSGPLLTLDQMKDVFLETYQTYLENVTDEQRQRTTHNLQTIATRRARYGSSTMGKAATQKLMAPGTKARYGQKPTAAPSNSSGDAHSSAT